jgi:hypothetical protein
MGINLINKLITTIMKTLKIGLAAMALLFAGATANAVEKSKSNQPTKDEIVNTYISAISTGNTKSLDKILENDMQFNSKRGNAVNTIDKNQLLDGMKNTIATTPVKTSTTVMEDNDDSEKIKVVFNYDGYVRTDIVTLDHTFGWKINSVTSSYN